MSAATADACRALRHHTWSGVRAEIALDVRRFLRETSGREVERVGFRRALSAMLTPPVLGVVLYRWSHYFSACGRRRMARAIAAFNFLLHKVTISPESCIAGGFWLPHPCGVVFHGRAGRDLGLYADCACIPLEPGLARPLERGPALGDRVLVGTHVAVLGPVRVGDGTKMPYKITLRDDAPANSVGASRAMRVEITVTASE